jgi:transcriptional regulator with XRE-family HTH domain
MKRKTTKRNAAAPRVTINFQPVDMARRERFPSLTDEQFAKMLGITPATYSDYKNRGTVPSLEVAVTAAIALDLDLRVLASERASVDSFFSSQLR